MAHSSETKKVEQWDHQRDSWKESELEVTWVARLVLWKESMKEIRMEKWKVL